ncbi:hypothetical protein EUX98_g4071 [Antrodiella citrinella]|uniref:ZZ-type domain-containing protein n=1 Tax=Antrodiella citrinella TaxID=2447956 RepID=A0A4S4MUV6_9APHY|nr:hypothetical protein EUX98_g4071 [Antrodiella citrinella]
MSSIYAPSESSWTETRLDRQLVVKCNYDGASKKITFTSSRACTYVILKQRVEQCFQLQTRPHYIQYTDDDGETTDITSDGDLSTAIRYFSSSMDDPPMSSAASFLSGRGLGRQKITMKVKIVVDYDGPALSDAGSIISVDEFSERNGSESSISFGGSMRMGEVDDDSITRLKMQESMEGGSPSSSFISSHQAWLRDQKGRAVKSVLGNLPEPSESDQLSVGVPDDARSSMSGDLELQKGGHGKFYYAYHGGSISLAHSSADSGYDDGSSMVYDTGGSSDSSRNNRVPVNHPTGPRPASSTSSQPPRASSSAGSHHHYNHRSHSEPILPQSDLPQELLPFITNHTIPPTNPTDCSRCGVFLETIRYVCSTCGEKQPRSQIQEQTAPGKGKGKDLSSETVNNPFTYPPPRRPLPSPGTSPSVSAWTLVADENPFHDAHALKFDTFGKPLPALPSTLPKSPSSPYLSIPNSPNSSGTNDSTSAGYELCASCIEDVGVDHSLHFSSASGSPQSYYPPSPQEASEWRRSAPKNKGQLRHAFLEKQWGARGWQDVEQDNVKSPKCSACSTMIVSKRYKCFSCGDYSLCRACYSQVHEIHPHHPFLLVPEKPIRMRSEPALDIPTIVTDNMGEASMVHAGVNCAHCLLEIVGARFHCAECTSVDICSNCDSAGLPGNLDSADGGHNSSHIMIKCANCEPRSYAVHDPTHIFFKLPRPVDTLIERDAPFVPPLYKIPAGPTGNVNSQDPKAYLQTLTHKFAVCDRCMSHITGEWFRCVYCPKDLCFHCEAVDTHNNNHFFMVLKSQIDMDPFRAFAQLGSSEDSPPVVTFPVYHR